VHLRNTRSLRLNALAFATAVVFAGTCGAAAAQQLSADARVQNLAAISEQGQSRFIVKFHDGSAQRSNASALQQTLNALGQSDVRGGGYQVSHNRRLAIGADVIETSKPLDRAAAERLMLALAANPEVEYVEPDAIMTVALTPNDTNYSQQWHYSSQTVGIRAPAAWDRTSGTGIRVAVIDTGIVAHSDLSANVVGGYDFISDSTAARDGNGRDSNPADQGDWTTGECGAASNSSWHGTHVAGTVAAVTNNAKGVAGVAFGAKVVPVRVLGKCGGSLSDIADAIIWSSGGTVSGVPANANPAEVINMSLGGSGACGSTYQAAIDGAVARGTTVVVAAGNSNANVSGFRPGNCNNVISVAATTNTGARASFSNYGTLIDVSAPGQGILSTLNAGTTTPGAESYASYNGTSMASPHVAGVVALMQATAVNTPAVVESRLKSSSYALPGACSGGCGAGIVDALAAVNATGGVTPPPPPPTGGTLSKGVAVTNLAAATGASLNYTMVVPAGSTNLSFVTSGGTGDMDMYVKFGSAPTDTVYDCRPYASGNAETCSFATPSAGTYYVRLKAYTSFSGLSLVGNYTAGGGGGGVQTYTNGTDFAILDNSTINSTITVSGRSGNASSTSKVNVRILHTYQGDLRVQLVAPDGTLYTLHNYTGGGTDNIITEYTTNLSSEALNGTWTLRVNDRANGDTGTLDTWSLTF
jgi:serine protease